MKRTVLLVVPLFLFLGMGMQAQVAINTDGSAPNDAAILDINAADKGLLIPRMVITDLDSDQTPVENPVEGLLIFNTGDTDLIPTGFYYWAGGKWQMVQSGNSSFTINQQMQMYEAAELFEDNSSPTTLSLPTSSDYYGWKSATEGETFGNTSTDTEDLTADKIIIGEDGLYKVEVCLSFSGSNNFQVEGVIFHYSVETFTSSKTKIRFLRKLAALDVGSASTHGLLRLQQGDKIDLRFKSTSGGETLFIHNINLIVNKVGEL